MSTHERYSETFKTEVGKVEISALNLHLCKMEIWDNIQNGFTTLESRKTFILLIGFRLRIEKLISTFQSSSEKLSQAKTSLRLDNSCFENILKSIFS